MLSSSFTRSCSCSLSLCLPRSVCCLSCTCFSVVQLIYFLCVENRNESEKRTQARRRQCRRKSWYDDGDNIVWSRIACAFSFLYFSMTSPSKHSYYMPKMPACTFQRIQNPLSISYTDIHIQIAHEMHCASTFWMYFLCFFFHFDSTMVGLSVLFIRWGE